MDTVTQQVEKEFLCHCTETMLVYRQCTDGRRQFTRQCQQCGRRGKVLPLKDLDVREMTLALPVNDDLSKEWYERRSKRYQEIQEEERKRGNQAWWQKYNQYLESDKWKEKRLKVLERDQGQCQACRKRPASQVHHLTYKHVFNEPLFDLISVCEPCHQYITWLDRGKADPTKD